MITQKASVAVVIFMLLLIGVGIFILFEYIELRKGEKDGS